MKFAFSAAWPDLPFDSIVAAVNTLGYDGAELNFPAPMSETFKIACLSGAMADGGQPNEGKNRSTHARGQISAASQFGCAIVKITESAIRAGQNRAASGLALGDWLLPLADYAADRGVTLALDNTQSLRTARETWTILDRLNHPSVGCCLDTLTLARLGESPQVVVPMLNSRIVYVQVSDAKDLSDPASDCDLGDGVVPIETAITRLRGIGYSGWMTVRLPGTAQPIEPRLSKALASLRAWTRPAERARAKIKLAR
jgi:sugar phosphate isomerase/epimerase